MRTKKNFKNFPNFTLATFIITYNCPINCPMCFFACGPEKKEVMSVDKAIKTLEEINRININTIGIAGGEPFTKFNFMNDLIKNASSYKMQTIVVTNAYWAITIDASLNKLEKLRKSGLGWLQISLDEQHQNFIPVGRVANALKAAIELDFEDIKLIGSSKGNSESFKYQLFYLKEICDVDLESIDIIDRPRVAHQYYEDPQQDKYTFQELANTNKLDLPIKKPADCLTELMIDVNGDLYPCCNNFIGRIGNVFENNLTDILSNMRVNKYFKIILNRNPFGLARYLDKNYDSFFCEKRYGSWCELCENIFQNERFKDLLSYNNEYKYPRRKALMY